MSASRVWDLWPLYRTYFLPGRMITVWGLLLLVSAAADLFCPYLLSKSLRILEDWHLSRGAAPVAAYRAMLLCAATMVVLMLSEYVARYRLSRMQNATVFHGSARLRSDLYAALQSEASATAADRRIGDALSHLVSDVSSLQDTALELISEAPRDVVMIVGIVTLMLWLCWGLGVIVLGFLAVAGVCSLLIARRGWVSHEQTQAQLGDLSARFQEALSAGRTLHVLNATGSEAAGLTAAAHSFAERQEDSSRVQAAMVPFFMLTEYVGLLLVLLAGGWFVLYQHLDLTVLIAFLAWMELLADPLSRVGRVLPRAQKAAAAAQRVRAALGGVVDIPSGTAPVHIAGRVVAEALVFHYPQVERAALCGVSFAIAAGERVAVIGRNGAGKSTLFDLLLRMHRPSGGALRVDDLDLSSIDAGYWRSLIGVVPQDVVLMNRSIADNIALGAVAAEDGVLHAARLAGIVDTIQALPQGFDTVVGERGALLSGGQRQRIAIARLLIRDPRIVLLDEPTSALDAAAERDLLPAIDRLCAGRTTFIISHRPAVLERADRVLVLDGGRLIADGPPTAVYASCPGHRDLFPPRWASGPSPAAAADPASPAISR